MAVKRGNYKPKKVTSKGYVGGIILLVVLIVLGIVYLTNDAKTTENEVTSAPATTETAEEPIKETSETAEEGFVLLDSVEPTLQGHNGYFTQEENGQKIWGRDKEFADTWCNSDTAVDGLKTFLGNQVYAVPASAITGAPVPEGQEDPTVYVQLYGYSPNVVDSDGFVRNISIWLRQEYTGKRIYVFDTQEELDEAQQAWDAGQAILNGTSDTTNALIVNGRLVTGGYPKFKDGECYIPLVYVASAVNPDLYANNTQTGVLTIPLQGCYAGATISVPYSLGSPGVYKSATFEAGNYYANLGEGATDDVYWTDNFTIGEGNACYVPASELSRYTGWYIYSDGKSVHVVTDETDVSDLFVLDTRGNRTAENQTINDGNTIIKYTDPNDEKLYNMMRDDGTLDENGDFVVDYEDSTTGIIEKQIEERGGDNE